MSIHVDTVGLATRTRALRAAGARAVTFQVQLPQHGRYAGHSLITGLLASAARDLPGTSWRAFPTSGGPCVWVSGTTDWKAVLAPLVQGLEAANVAASVTVPQVGEIDGLMLNQPVRPTAFAALTLQPPITEFPLNQWGVPEFRWGVSDSASDAVLGDSSPWVLEIHGSAEVRGAGPTVPATAEDAADVVRASIDYARQGLTLQAFEPDAQLYRSMTLGYWGQATLADIGPRSYLDLAESLSLRLQRMAEYLDVGMVSMAHPLFPLWSGLREGSRWLEQRSQWSTHVLDVNGVQVLTSMHLERANNLDAWIVRKVSAGRWLVQASDLHLWYDVPDDSAWSHGRFPLPSVLDSARGDFGRMILNDRLVETQE